MENLHKNAAAIHRVLIIMPLAILAIFIMEVIYIQNFNNQSHSFLAKDESFPITMNIGGRSNSTSEWKKRDFDLYGETVDLNAQTIDCTLTNDSDYEIKEWQMRIDIKDDCFINNAWCGKMEIHQDVLTKEKVQTIDLRNYELEDIELDHIYDGDLLIRLSKGDYLVYYPSSVNDEMPLEKHSQLTMGFILYYLDFPDLSSSEVSYHFGRKLTDGYGLYGMIFLTALWFIMLMMHLVSFYTYRAAVREMEIKKSGILSMSDIYSIIYIIDLKNNELTPLVADEESEKLRPEKLTASEQLRNMFEYDSVEAYKDVAMEFCDMDLLAEKLSQRDTVAFEYQSRIYGWCRIRFFAMDREADRPLEKVVFTIQVINEEKEEIEAIAQRVNDAESASKAKSTVLSSISQEIRTPINAVLDFDTRILAESKDPSIQSYARNIHSAARTLLSLVNGILDISQLEADKMELRPEEYSFEQMISEVTAMIAWRTELKELDFECEISNDLPDALYGDSARIKQVLVNLLTNAVKYTDEGSVKLTVFGKKHDHQVHLLFSVKDTGIGIQEEELKNLAEHVLPYDNRRNKMAEGTGIGLSLAGGILAQMDSELRVISTYGEGSEFYFEIEQEVVENSSRQ